MTILLKNGNLFTSNGFMKSDIYMTKGKIFFIREEAPSSGSFISSSVPYAESVIDCNGLYIVPGFVDVHVHFREPGFFYKETIKTGASAAARGGYTCVCTMPNVNPAPTDLKSLKVQLEIICKDSKIHIVPYGTITSRGDGRSKLGEMEQIANFVLGFSDDGKGVQRGNIMEKAMKMAKSLNKPIVAHCEDESLLHGGYIHQGTYAKTHGHNGISSESEWVQIKRDVALAEKTGCPYHVCHISTKESVDIIRNAKARGVDVTCETAPHYLILCDDDLKEEGIFKMNPPLRSKDDRAALIEGIKDGTIDMIATDHAPHSLEEKSKGLKGSAFGIVGLETSFSLLYTELVLKRVISFQRLMELMSGNPIRRFKLPGIASGYIQEGSVADITILDLNKKYTINPATFLSKGKSTPFEGWQVQGQVVATFADGKPVYKSKGLI